MAGSEERDPVCGILVDPVTATFRHVHGGRSYVFCDQRCVDRFKADPSKYLRPLPRGTNSSGETVGGASSDANTPKYSGARGDHHDVRTGLGRRSAAWLGTNTAWRGELGMDGRHSNSTPRNRGGGRWAMWICAALLALVAFGLLWR